jgi:hypothetical protein
MLSLLRKLFGGKAEETKAAEAPYKIETPAPTPVAEQATQAVVESIAPKAEPVKKKPAPKKAPAKATAKKAPAKKAPKK